jgi:glycosyltransferase involved in cell wall biosynthesis
MAEIRITELGPDGPQPALVFGDMQVVDADLKPLHPSYWRYQKVDPAVARNWIELLVQNPVAGCSSIMNSAAVRVARSTPDKGLLHDHLAAVLAARFGTVSWLDEPTMLYRQHSRNVVGARRFGLKFLGGQLPAFLRRSLPAYLDMARRLGSPAGAVVLAKLRLTLARFRRHGRDAGECRAAFIGAVGIPNRYGGFEAFLDHCSPVMRTRLRGLIVTCDGSLYPDRSVSEVAGIQRLFIPVRANGAASVLHDLLAFCAVFPRASHIVVLGVSGGIWFPLMRLMCTLGGKRLLVNIDGVEWKRGKFKTWKKALLWTFDWCAQTFAHRVVYDNAALVPRYPRKSAEIAYSGDQVLRLPQLPQRRRTALTICRIEPENNIDMLIEGVLLADDISYVVIGNWNHSEYGRALRARYADQPRLRLLDPEYDPVRLAEFREQCAMYVHGHSVGGTNPSLVEMLFYDSDLFCFDVAYHRASVGPCARYFKDAASLACLLKEAAHVAPLRGLYRERYTRARISQQYIRLMLS